MNPQMVQMAQEMMSKMTPEQMQAMMSSMGNLNPAMMQQAMQQMQNMSPADMENMRRQMGSMDPGTVASQAQQAAKQLSAQQQYKYNASMQLKSEGNRLHTAARYSEAAEKYARAQDNLSELHTQEARDLRKACVLNLSSCYLNMGQHQQCVEECNVVLQDDPQNLKALYRRGQAHAALSHHQEAEADLQLSLQLSAHDQQQQQLIQEKLRAVKVKLAEQRQQHQQQTDDTSHSRDVKDPVAQEASEDGLIEEIHDSMPAKEQNNGDSDADMPVLEEIGLDDQQQQRQQQQQQATEPSHISTQHMPGLEGLFESQQTQMRQMADMMKANPQMYQQAAEMMRTMPASAIADMSREAGMPIDSAAVAEMQKNMAAMSPQQLEMMMKLSAGQANNPAAVAETFTKDPELLKSAAKMMQSMPQEQLRAALAQSGMPSNIDPAMLSMATEAMSKMPPDQLQQMMQMAAGLQGSRGAAGKAAAAPPAPGNAGNSTSKPSIASSPAVGSRESEVRPAAPASGGVRGADLNAMMTPEMMQMAADMMQNMKPEDMMAMQQMMQGGGVAPGAEQVMTPEMMKMAASMMKNMKPEDLATMQQMMGAGGAGGVAPGASIAGGNMPTGLADMMGKMNPQMVEEMFRSLQAMDEASLTQMFKGMAGSESQAAAMAAQVKKLSPTQLRMIGSAAGVVQAGIHKAQLVRHWLSSNLVLVLCVVVLIIALLLRWFGVM